MSKTEFLLSLLAAAGIAAGICVLEREKQLQELPPIPVQATTQVTT